MRAPFCTRCCSARPAMRQRPRRWWKPTIRRPVFASSGVNRARSLGFGLKIHAEQFARTGAARLAVELGAVSADHLEQAGDEDIRALAQSNTIATLLPGSVFHLGLRTYAPGSSVAMVFD